MSYGSSPSCRGRQEKRRRKMVKIFKTANVNKEKNQHIGRSYGTHTERGPFDAIRKLRSFVGKRINLEKNGIYSFDLEKGTYSEYDITKLSEEELNLINTPSNYDNCYYIITSDEIIAHATFFISEMVKDRPYIVENVDKTKQLHKKNRDKGRSLDRSIKYSY